MKPTPEQLHQAAQFREAAEIIETGCEWEEESLSVKSRFGNSAFTNPGEAVAHGRTIRKKPWTLGRSINGHTLGEGQEWYSRNWEFLSVSASKISRPLLIGEVIQLGDRCCHINPGAAWGPCDGYAGIAIDDSNDAFTTKTDRDKYAFATTRPIPQLPLKWAAEREAFTRGEKVESIVVSMAPNGTNWRVDFNPHWDNPDFDFRIAKPASAPVPLYADDIDTLVEFQHKSGTRVTWQAMSSDGKQITINGIPTTWATLMHEGWKYRRPGQEWQLCSKEAAQ